MLQGATSVYNAAVDVWNRNYWRRLNPTLSVTHRAFEIDPLIESFRAEGWLQSDPVIETRSLRSAVEALVREKWLPVFAFVYEEFWLGGRLDPLVQALLGPGCRQKPYLWIQHVEPAASSSGWPPHVDQDPPTKDISVWIPLTDATLDNGCMYLMPSYAPKHDLQSIRALPARAGSILAWRQDVLHWGAYSSRRAKEPRISIALEFGREGLDPAAVPPFEERLKLIARQILKYLEEFEPGRYEERWMELADKILAA
jgi:hypothetical protein